MFEFNRVLRAKKERKNVGEEENRKVEENGLRTKKKERRRSEFYYSNQLSKSKIKIKVKNYYSIFAQEKNLISLKNISFSLSCYNNCAFLASTNKTRCFFNN